MKKTTNNYVSTTLDGYLNESRNITLTRKYGSKEPVVVSSKAPLRNKILAFVAENVKVTKNALKRHMMSLNESSTSSAAASMWMKRNAQYFITESKNGVTFYKLSNIGKKLISTFGIDESISEGCNCGSTKIIKKPGSKKTTSKRTNESEEEDGSKKVKTHDFEDDGEKGIYDEKNTSSTDKVNEGKKKKKNKKKNKKAAKKIKNLVESIKARRMFEAEDVDKDDVDDEDSVDAVDDDAELKDDVDDEDNTDDVNDEDDTDTDDDKVEITEFIITVDDPESAIAELAELGIDAEIVTDEAPSDEIETKDDLFADDSDEDSVDDVDDEDLDLDIDGEIEGEDSDKKNESMNEEDEEPAEDELFSDEPIEDEATKDDEVDEPVEDDEVDEPAVGNQIKVSADNWDALKGWLEEKGVDTEELFGGEIVSEDDDDIEDEIDFDELEDLEDYDDDTKKDDDVEDSDDSNDSDEKSDEKDKPKFNFDKK